MDEKILNISADDAIVGLKTIGFVDTDGAKLSAIAVEYNVDLTGAQIDTGIFEIGDYGLMMGDSKCEIGCDPGKPVKAYVNDKAEVSAAGGSGTGKYVIIEVNTDYQLGMAAISHKLAMHADVLQTGTITTNSHTITPGTNKVTNYTVTKVQVFRDMMDCNLANDGTYTILGIEAYQLFTKETGSAFHAANCFEEATGEYMDVDLPYALYVPEDYDPNKKYALILHIHDAGFLGDDPIITLTEAQGPNNFASEKVQQILKDQGLGGLIVVAPQINFPLRSARDNWTVSAAVPATWQLLDHLTATYNIDSDRIYATGQSMGAMQSLAMAAQRDNYFAGILAIGCQWGTNYNKDSDYQGDIYHAAPADGKLIWTKDSDGNPCDYNNWFYMVSDDNILVMSCAGDKFATGVWNELKFLYSDLAGAQIPQTIWNPLTLTKDEQNAKLADLVAQKNDLGFYWASFEGGNHMATWVYAHGLSAAYDWLFTQTRETEMARKKLPLDKPFVAAAEQIKTEERLLNAEKNIYFLTGEHGSGTADYNTTTYAQAGRLYTYPNWKPAD